MTRMPMPLDRRPAHPDRLLIATKTTALAVACAAACGFFCGFIGGLLLGLNHHP